MTDLLDRLKNGGGTSFESIQILSLAYHFELLLRLSRWQDAKQVVETAVNAGMPIKLFHKIADVACGALDCPADGKIF